MYNQSAEYWARRAANLIRAAVVKHANCKPMDCTCFGRKWDNCFEQGSGHRVSRELAYLIRQDTNLQHALTLDHITHYTGTLDSWLSLAREPGLF